MKVEESEEKSVRIISYFVHIDEIKVGAFVSW